MKSYPVLAAAAALVAVDQASAFVPSLPSSASPATGEASSTARHEYIPSGMSKAQWEKIKNKEKSAKNGKNLGQVGIASFKSRTFAEWQKAGGKNLFPVDPNKVKSQDEIPYMQRANGSADGSDLGGGAKKKAPTFFQMGGKKKAPEPEPEK